MCNICGTPEQVAMGRRDAGEFATQLQKLSLEYRKLEHGSVMPHTEDWAKNRYLAKSIIRRLVEDWI